MKKILLLLTSLIFFSSLASASPSITELNAQYEKGDLLLNYSCNPTSIASIEATDLENWSTKLTNINCGTNLSTIITNVPPKKIIQVELQIQEPCTLCRKTIYLNTEPYNQNTKIPDYSALTTGVLLGTVILILTRKKH
jgi:hypothetical protein